MAFLSPHSGFQPFIRSRRDPNMNYFDRLSSASSRSLSFLSMLSSPPDCMYMIFFFDFHGGENLKFRGIVAER